MLSVSIHARVKRATATRSLSTGCRACFNPRPRETGDDSGLLIMALTTLLLSLGYWTWRRELDLAKERTIDSAMQGRFKDAEDHLDRVRRLRGSEGWVRMLEGQIALHKGDYAQANQSLREANRLMPESTAAYALFNVAQWLSGNEDEYFRCLPTLEACEPADFYDKLFKGYAENWFLSERALNHLDAAVKERPDNHVAKAFHAVLNGLGKPSAASGKVMVTEGLEDLSAVLRYCQRRG